MTTLRQHLEAITAMDPDVSLTCEQHMAAARKHAFAALKALDEADRPRADLTYQYVPTSYRLVSDPEPGA